MTVFSDQWMVYDRYGQFMLDAENTQHREPCLGPATCAAIEGPVPNTLYADKGDSKTLSRDDDLVLTPEADAHFKRLAQIREGKLVKFVLRPEKESIN